MSHPPKPQGRYRKVQQRTWSDDNFRALSDMGKLLWFFLLTGPQTGPIPGLYRAGRAAMAEELDWPLDDFYARFEELEMRGMVRADWKARLVWLPNALKHNLPESPNVIKAWRADLDLLPECELKTTALADIRALLATMGESDAFAAAFDAIRGKVARNPAKPSPMPMVKALPEALPEALPQALPEALVQGMGESGTGTGTGTGTGNPPAASTQAAPPAPALPAAPPPGALGPTLHSAGELSAVMRAYGVNANPGHPDLVTLAAQGVTPANVQAACEEAKRSKQGQPFGMAYVMRILERWKAANAKLDLAGVTAPKPSPGAWWASDAAIMAKGTEFGLSPRAGESMPAFKGRVELAIGGNTPPPSPSRVTAPGPIETRGKMPEGLDLKALLRQATARAP